LGADGDLSARASITRADELGQVARRLNGAIAAHADVRDRLAALSLLDTTANLDGCTP
jgi:methyl-accepting chemotaxis protein